jgi:DNA-directed RNA polymerase subunit RPC12/RpoP
MNKFDKCLQDIEWQENRGMMMCTYCDDKGVIEPDNNGPIVRCPVCGFADRRPKKNGWAPGFYLGPCRDCGNEFEGDKRASQCANCAYNTPIKE